MRTHTVGWQRATATAACRTLGSPRPQRRSRPLGRRRPRSATWTSLLLLATVLACASPYDGRPDSRGAVEPASAAEGSEVSDYLRLVVVRDPFSSTFLMHWPKWKMPLRVHLPAPPAGLFEDPEAVEAAVRKGVVDWTDVAAPGVPSFRFVDDQGKADIPIVWAEEPDGDWYVAFCAYDVVVPRLFGVAHILVTGRWRDGRIASPATIYEVTLHEMGHALGLMGHSDSPADVMWPRVDSRVGEGLSPADRLTLRKLYEHGIRPYNGRRGRRY